LLPSFSAAPTNPRILAPAATLDDMGINQPADDGVLAAPIEFAGPDEIVLRGQRFGAGDSWAILVHGEGRDLDVWRQLTTWLAARGLSVVAFDLPGHGASDDPWEPQLALPAVAAAVAFARTKGSQQVHLVGEGVGAIAALAVAAGDSDVRSVAVLSPQADDRVAKLTEVREARVPKLILVGSLGRAAAQFAEVVFRSAIGPCEMARFPVAAQGADLLDGEWRSQVREKLLAHVLRQG
jgi:pimeloyl-ACP methyl ester carboxylesterase